MKLAPSFVVPIVAVFCLSIPKTQGLLRGILENATIPLNSSVLLVKDQNQPDESYCPYDCPYDTICCPDGCFGPSESGECCAGYACYPGYECCSTGCCVSTPESDDKGSTNDSSNNNSSSSLSIGALIGIILGALTGGGITCYFTCLRIGNCGM